MRYALVLAGTALWPVPLTARQSVSLQELPTRWEAPPGEPLEHETAGFAKVLCSAIFITGRDLATAAEEDGFFVSPPASRRLVADTVVDRRHRAVRLTLASGVTRTAQLYGD